ncbi:MAG TPA: branched-chain amino acid ABC transporter permease [Micromonosporaceae bacterium]|nr:branched-chain amino acid ABC transporter permease [Micromonosporaceae bacterium]
MGMWITGKWARWILLAVAVIVALWLPNGLYPAVAVEILCWALFAVAIDLLLGYVGLLSFGHAAFWGASAYATGLAAIHWHFPFPLAVLSGALVATILAVPIGYLAVKRTGIYFAMVTLAFAQMIYVIANKWSSLTGGENGLQSVPRAIADNYYFYYAALPIVAGGLFLAWRIVHSPFGRVLVAIRDNPSRARALGYPVHWYKLMAFMLSAFLAGLGGGLFAMGHRFVSLDVLHWTTSGKAVIVVVLGGIGTLWGGVLGAGFLVRLEDFLSFSGFDQIGLVTGAIFVAAVLLFRRGVWGTFLKRK